ncbi:MAG: hypothetical protein WCI45_14275 [Desulfuromonadales bacterium]
MYILQDFRVKATGFYQCVTSGRSFATALITIAMLGATAAYAGGAHIAKGAARVAFWVYSKWD